MRSPTSPLSFARRTRRSRLTSPIRQSAATELPADYDYVFEAVREGHLLHYDTSRLLCGQDDDLALLAGDYLYALGIERLAAIGDTDTVLLLADLISTSAQLHTEGRTDELPDRWSEVGTSAPYLTLQSRTSVVVTCLPPAKTKLPRANG